MQAPTPAAVIFDMDGLMLDTESIYQRAWQQAATELGYHMEESFFSQLTGQRTEDCEAQIFDVMGDDFPLAAFHTRWMNVWEEMAAADGIALKPGLVELLDQIDALGIPKAVATSSTRAEADRSLGTTGLDGRFSVVVTGDEVARGKPAPDIFLEAARRLHVPSSGCWALEDSNAGAIAAAAAGMRVYIVPDLRPPSKEAANRAAGVLGSLRDLVPLLNAANADAPGLSK